MEDNTKARVYVLIDEENRITRIEGEYSLPDNLTGWILIDEGDGDKYTHAQTQYLEDGLTTDDGFYQYKYVDEEVVKRTDEEIEADRAAEPIIPTPMEILEAQVYFTAVETDTLLEEG